MAEEEGEVAAEDAQEAPTDKKDKKEKKGSNKKDKKKKTWDEKVEAENKKKKNQFMPWGSDPCVKIRTKLGKLPKNDLTAVKGSNFPWYEAPRKVKDVQKDEEKKEKKKRKQDMSENEEKFQMLAKKHMERIKMISEENHKRRVFECNRKPGDTETYEEYCARKEKSEKKRRKRKREEEEEEEEGEGETGKGEKKKRKKEEKSKKGESGEEEEGEGEVEEGEENKGKVVKKEISEGKTKPDDKGKEGVKVDKSGSKKEDVKKKQVDWPGSYPCSVTEDFITMLKMVIEAEYETKQSERKKKKCVPKPTKKDKILNEFTSFLNVLFTANEMMKKNDEGESDGASGEKNSSSKKLEKRQSEDEKELKSTDYGAEEKEDTIEEAPAEENAEEEAAAEE